MCWGTKVCWGYGGVFGDTYEGKRIVGGMKVCWGLWRCARWCKYVCGGCIDKQGGTEVCCKGTRITCGYVNVLGAQRHAKGFRGILGVQRGTKRYKSILGVQRCVGEYSGVLGIQRCAEGFWRCSGGYGVF